MTPTKLHKDRCGKESNLEVLPDDGLGRVERVSEYSTTFRYVCECGKTIYGESWDIQEAPVLRCPTCYERMDIEMGWTDE